MPSADLVGGGLGCLWTGEVLEDIKTYLDEKLISFIMQNIDIVLDYSFWSREMRNQCMTGYLLGCVFRITCSIELVAHR